MDHRLGAKDLRFQAEIQQLTALLDPQFVTHGYLVMICDLTRAGAVSAAGRRFLANWLNCVLSEWIFIRAGLLQLTIVTMIEGGSRLLKAPKRSRAPKPVRRLCCRSGSSDSHRLGQSKRTESSVGRSRECATAMDLAHAPARYNTAMVGSVVQPIECSFIKGSQGGTTASGQPPAWLFPRAKAF